jgi:hypothetical protein
MMTAAECRKEFCSLNGANQIWNEPLYLRRIVIIMNRSLLAAALLVVGLTACGEKPVPALRLRLRHPLLKRRKLTRLLRLLTLRKLMPPPRLPTLRKLMLPPRLLTPPRMQPRSKIYRSTKKPARGPAFLLPCLWQPLCLRPPCASQNHPPAMPHRSSPAHS